MVFLHVKGHGEEQQFLFETTCKESVDLVIR